MKKEKYLILTINPGSTSTKIGVYENEEEVFKTTVKHSNKMLDKYQKIWDQYSFRKDEIVEVLKKESINLGEMDAIVARGGLIRPIASGVYDIDEKMIEDARVGFQGQHASNLGCVIAYGIAWEYAVPSFIVDPPAVDELEPFARVSGISIIERNSLFHALNIFSTARIFAADQKKKFDEMNIIVAHLGGGITVAGLKKGRAINVNNGLGEGPFSPERSGGLPLMQFIDLCFSGEYTQNQVKKIVAGKGGLVSYFGTNNANDVENMIKAGNKDFEKVYAAMGYQIAEEIGARATNLKGKVDAIVLTGGIAYSDMLNDWIKERVGFIAPVYVYPGENELKALALGGLRVLRGDERSKSYSISHKKIGVLCWTEIDLYEKAVSVIEETFCESGYNLTGPDKNLEILYDNCQQSEDKLRENIESFNQKKIDLLFAIGTPASVRAKHYMQNSSIPFVSVGIYSPLILGVIDKKMEDKLYASCYSVKMMEQLENTILNVDPEIKRIGVLYRTGEIQADIQMDEIKKICQKKEINLSTFDLAENTDLNDAYEYFKKEKIEWLILTADTSIANTKPEQLQKLTYSFPTMCVLEKTILDGGLIGFVHPWEDVCKKGAFDALQILEGNRIKDQTFKPEKKKLVINLKTAKKLKMYTSLQKQVPYAEFL